MDQNPLLAQLLIIHFEIENAAIENDSVLKQRIQIWLLEAVPT